MEPLLQDSNDPLKTVHAFATDTHTQLHNSLTFADQKAGFLFGTVAAILAYLHTSGATNRLIQNLRAAQPGFSDLLVGVALLGLAVAAICALLVVIPRAPTGSKGITASWNIASYENAQEFVEQVLQSDSATLARAKLEYCWILAHIGRRKYRFVNLALRFGFVGLAASIAYLALG